MLINHNKYAGLVTGGNIKTGKGIGKKENIHTKILSVNGDTALIGTPGMDSGIKDFAYSASMKSGFVGEDTDFLKIPQKFPGPSGLDTGDISFPPAIDDATEKELPFASGNQTGETKLPGKGIYEKITLNDGWNIANGNDSWTMELDGKPVILENHMPYEKETFSFDSIRNHDEPPLYNVADSGLFDHLKDAGFDVKKVDVPVVEHEWAHDMLLKTDFDTRHIPVSFWSNMERDVRQYSEKLNKPDFFLMGEDFGEPAKEYKPADDLSIYVPHTDEKHIDYSELAFAKNVSWEEALKKLGERPEGEVSDAKGDIKELERNIVELIKKYPTKKEPEVPLWKEIYDANSALPEDKRKSFKELAGELYNEGDFSKQLDELAVACKATKGDRFEAGMDFLLKGQEEIEKEIAKEIKDSGILTVTDTAEQVKADTEQSLTMKELKNATIETSKTGEINRYTMLPSEDSEAGHGWSI